MIIFNMITFLIHLGFMIKVSGFLSVRGKNVTVGDKLLKLKRDRKDRND